MRIAHLSDIHFTAEYDIGRVVDALIKDLVTAHQSRRIDVLAFTGDLASKGGYDNATPHAPAKATLGKILGALGALGPLGGTPSIVICPGNHDVNLKNRDELYASIFSSVKSAADANKLVESASKKPTSDIWGHISQYLDVAKALDPQAYEASPLFYAKRLDCDGLSVGLASFNSAWMTRGGGDADYGHLFIGERQIDLAAAMVADCDVRIALMHHPLDWLSPSEKGAIRRALETKFEAVLCGHQHEAEASQIMSNVGGIFLSQTGCIYQAREYFNGYSILDREASGGWRVTAREYYSQRDAFDAAPRFAEGGFKDFPPSSHLATGFQPVSGETYTGMQERGGSKLLSYSSSAIAPKQLGAMFVEPPLATVAERQLAAEEGRMKGKKLFFTLRELAGVEETILLFGKRESGKTVLLHQIALNRFDEFKREAVLGIVIDFATLARKTEAAVLERAVEFTGGDLTRKQIIDVLTQGSAVFCVDNLALTDDESRQLFRDFQARFPRVRYIASAAEEDLFRHVPFNELKLPDLGQPYRSVFVHSLRRKHIGELTRKWFGRAAEGKADLLAHIDKLLQRLNVPRTPFLVSVLLWVIEHQPSAQLVNQASAVQSLIEGLLEKFSEAKTRVGIDSNVKQHFLREFAQHLDHKRIEWLPQLEFQRFALQYFEARGLQESPQRLADELLRKGLLYESGDRVSFKFDCFRAYFLAQKFFEEPDLWRLALSESEISRYGAELDLFTGLYRDRNEALELAMATCLSLLTKTSMNMELDSVPRIGKDAFFSDAAFDRLADSIESPQDEDDQDKTVPSASSDQDLARVRPQVNAGSAEIRLIEAVRIFSTILRNSELVDDVSLKREAFRACLELWCKMLLSVTIALRKAAERDKHVEPPSPGTVDVAGVLLPESKVREIVSVLLPQMMVMMAVDAIATPKLDLFIAELLTDSRVFIRMLAVLLAVETRIPSAMKEVRSLLSEPGAQGFVSQLMFFCLLAEFIRRRNDGGSVDDLREGLAMAYSSLSGKSGIKGGAEKAKFLQALEKHLVVTGAADGIGSRG